MPRLATWLFAQPTKPIEKIIKPYISSFIICFLSAFRHMTLFRYQATDISAVAYRTTLLRSYEMRPPAVSMHTSLFRLPFQSLPSSHTQKNLKVLPLTKRRNMNVRACNSSSYKAGELLLKNELCYWYIVYYNNTLISSNDKKAIPVLFFSQ